MPAVILRLLLLLLIAQVNLSAEDDTEEVAAKLDDEIHISQHELTIAGKIIGYTATTGRVLLYDPDEEDKAKARLFFTAYTTDKDKPSERPLTFSFNGGPGSSSVWLHLGCLGPRRLLIENDLESLRPPAELTDNEHSLLSHSDLVFIDPVSAGYSRPLEGEDPKQFHGFEEDLRWVAEFIRLYSTRYKRWLSPKFLCGESYGTTRAAGLANYLHNNLHMRLNGVILISPILQFHLSESFSRELGNDLPYALNLPSLTAGAWYHGKLSGKLQDDLDLALSEARKFAMTDYLLALAKGDHLSDNERDRIITQLKELTGLSASFIERNELRVPAFRFMKELLREEGHTVGRFDCRIKGVDREAAGEYFEYDPSYDNISGAFASAFNHYVRDELGWEGDQPYQLIANVRPWNFSRNPNNTQALEVADDLREVMVKNHHLRVFSAHGHFDLATPFFPVEYTYSHMQLPKQYRDHIRLRYYAGGHMMYTDQKELAKLMSDLRQFYTETE